MDSEQSNHRIKIDKITEVKPDELTSIDHALWSNLLEALNPLMCKRNRNSWLSVALGLLCIIAMFVVVWTGELTELFDSRGATIAVVCGYLGFLILTIIYMSVLDKKNRRIDVEIHDVVSSFELRFVAQGHELRYVEYERLEWGIRSWTTVIDRYLEFPPLAAAASANATNDNVTNAADDDEFATADIESNHVPTMKSEFDSTTKEQENNAADDAATTGPSVVDQMMKDLERPLGV